MKIIAPVPENAGHGFWYYTAWVILTPIALIAIVILTVVLITLLMAAYFYAVSWWKGELSPPIPPTTPDFSAQLNDDLAASLRRSPGEPSKAGEVAGEDK